MLAIIANQQIELALEAVHNGPTDPRYRWAMEYLAITAKSALAAIADPRERTRLATETRMARAEVHREGAARLRREGLTAAKIGERIAADEGRRWLSKAGKSSG